MPIAFLLIVSYTLPSFSYFNIFLTDVVNILTFFFFRLQQVLIGLIDFVQVSLILQLKLAIKCKIFFCKCYKIQTKSGQLFINIFCKIFFYN